MFSQFGEWIHMDRPLKPVGFLSYLDQGLPNRWFRIFVVIGYILINLLAGALQSF